MPEKKDVGSKTVLISPLNWGLGHASRCIPLIKKYQSDGYRVVIGADGAARALLLREFPDLHHEEILGFKASYSRNLPFYLHLMARSPLFFYSMHSEHQRLVELCEKYGPELIISDNRYGLWHPDIKSVLVTHQLFPIAPKLIEGIMHRYLVKCFDRFDEIWVPDYEGEFNLSGKLSHGEKMPLNVKYIGPLSRFEEKCNNTDEYETEYLGIVSGPEPHRQLLFNKLKALFKLSGKRCILIGGTPEKSEIYTEENLTVYNHQSTAEIFHHIGTSRNIICRSGYSSIMDFEKTGRKAYLIPTPGQTEQEYLAEYLNGKINFTLIREEQLQELILHS